MKITMTHEWWHGIWAYVGKSGFARGQEWCVWCPLQESIILFIYMNLNDYFCLSLMFYTYSYTYIELFVISTEFFYLQFFTCSRGAY